ncbi:MAG: lipid II:glycine glycyltransferase FemX [Candidatus Limnocylindria bacterium]
MTSLSASEVDDAASWNAFVESARYGAFPQLWEWGELRRAAGWRPLRLAVGEAAGGEIRAGTQLLLKPIPVIGWHLAYAPRGPIGALDDEATRTALLAAVRGVARREKIATLRVDPEATPEDALGGALSATPWRAAEKVQPPRTRLIDLSASEDDLRGAMKKKHRQYVAKAEREGIEIERFDSSSAPDALEGALDDFNRIYRLTAERAGFVARVPAYYVRVWDTMAPRGHARLSFAMRQGERVATLFHFTCGPRAVEAYGGMTDAGAESRANYLLKWEAIRGFREEGFAVYDVWGLATGGIARFKEGFGGREVEYVGARELRLRAPVDALLRVAIPAYGAAQRARLRLLGRRAPAEGVTEAG